MSEVLLIIPAYNEEGNICKVVDELSKEYADIDYIVVNDGSTDSTETLCRCHEYNLLNLKVNLGLAGAFQAGMRYALEHNYSYAVQFDGDGQHRAEYVYTMLDKIKQGYDIIIASRFVDKKKPYSVRMIGSRLISLAIHITTGVSLTDPTSGMRMYSKRAIREFAYNINYAPEPDTISYLIKKGIRIAEIQAHMDERLSGVSYLTPISGIKYMLRMLISIVFIQNFRR